MLGLGRLISCWIFNAEYFEDMVTFIATVNVYGEVRVFHFALEFAKVRSASRALYHFDPLLSMFWTCDKRIMHYLFQFLLTNYTVKYLQ